MTVLVSGLAVPFGLNVATTTGNNSGARMDVFEKDTSQGADSRIVVGDLVRITTSGKVARYSVPTTATNGSLIGVAAQIFDENKNPYVFPTPSNNGRVSVTANSDYISVYNSPDLVFAVAAEEAAVGTPVGTVVGVSAGEGEYNLKLGRSGMKATAATPAAGITAPLRVVGHGSEVGVGDKVLLVTLNDHNFRQ